VKITLLLPPGEYLKNLTQFITGFKEEVFLFTELNEEALKTLEETDILISTPFFPLRKNILERMKNLKFVQVASTGYDHIDVDYLKSKGIIVSNVPDANDESVAEYVIMVALAFLKRFEYSLNSTRKGEWVLGELANTTYDLKDKIFGILGMGRKGKALTKRLINFEVTIIYHDIRKLNEEEENKLGARYVELEKLFQYSDIISIHLPLNETTRNLVNINLLKMAKNNCFIINTSRGEIVNVNDIIEALNKGIIAGYATDVYSKEPPEPDDPLLKHPKVIVTPHQAGVSKDATMRIAQKSFSNVLLFLQGGKPINQV
jgi:lactate dehydrogenase-like 2-hydroxyacid dehydrogenase